MSSNRESFERSPNARPLWMCLVMNVFVLATAGCSGSPTFNILGSYFPSWLVCLAIAIGLTFLTHLLITARKLADELWPLPIVYSALLSLFSCTLWLIFFE